ncbi:MAG: alpha/beta fold hydrolase [Clostridia bacterium]|nr:alpha/beta fold hydrolase [Clostridia bacterium]
MIIHTTYKDVQIKIFNAKQQTNEVLIAIHGLAGDADSSAITAVAEQLINNNVTVVAFDLHCHGKDNNKLLQLDKCLNYISTINNFVKENYSNKPISYFATSFGAFLLLNYLNKTNQQVKNVVLRAPAIFINDVLVKILHLHNSSLQQLKNKQVNISHNKEIYINFDFYEDLHKKNLSKYNKKYFLHIIQGKKDDLVDYKQNENFFQEKCDKLHKLYYFENADHRFKKPGELEQIVDILKSIILQ